MYLVIRIIHALFTGCNFYYLFFVKSSRTSIKKSIGVKMIDKIESNDEAPKYTVYGTIGMSIFLIFWVATYALPSMFPKGSLVMIAGILFILVNIIKSLKKIEYSLPQILFGIAILIFGLNKVFMLGIGYISVFVIVFAVTCLVQSFGKLRKGQIYE